MTATGTFYAVRLHRGTDREVLLALHRTPAEAEAQARAWLHHLRTEAAEVVTLAVVEPGTKVAIEQDEPAPVTVACPLFDSLEAL